MSARLLSNVAELRAYADEVRARRLSLAVVPTMGALHEGHLSLVREAKRRCDAVIVTIFVNPTQFGPGEDFSSYPRDLARDTALAESAGATALFTPTATEMYPPGESTRVSVAELTDELCGRQRPGHFIGVATVVAKLFNAVGPSVAVFGRKDYQQLQVIRRMVRDLFFPIEVVAHPIVREADGLALSSRNAYLSARDRARALSIPRSLAAVSGAFANGERSVRVLRETVRGALDRAGLQVEYVELADPETLSLLEDPQLTVQPALLAVAARAGKTRLIDNILLGVDSSPELGG